MRFWLRYGFIFVCCNEVCLNNATPEQAELILEETRTFNVETLNNTYIKYDI